MKLFIQISVIVLMLGSCTRQQESQLREKAQVEIREAEHAFTQMAAEQGVPAAFLAFAADDAVMLRGKKLVQGKAAIQAYFEGQTLQDVKLEWEPDFVEAAASGDLGYTYGRYTFSARDSSGTLLEDEGIFHTVWKRQEDGKWRFVWD